MLLDMVLHIVSRSLFLSAVLYRTVVVNFFNG